MESRDADVLESCVGFTRALRKAGVAAVDSQGFVTGLSVLNPLHRDDVYWAGRSTLCASRQDLPTYDRLFAEWFDSTDRPTDDDEVTIVPAAPSEGDDDGAGEAEDEDRLYAASRKEVLRYRDMATLSDTEQREVAELFDSLVVELPERRTRRHARWHRGEIDVRATVREQLRGSGEIGLLRHRRPRKRLRKLVILIDVSRSMEPYADSLIRLAHTVFRVAPASVEVFTMGTRLTRITRALDPADRERALRTAGGAIPDWSGGTRLADGISAFVNRWGRRGMARQAVVVVASDGWERGDTDPLSHEAERLSKLAHRVIWVNPHSGKIGYEPVQSGIRAVLPHIDHMVAGHTFDAFARFLEVLSDV